MIMVGLERRICQNAESCKVRSYAFCVIRTGCFDVAHNVRTDTVEPHRHHTSDLIRCAQLKRPSAHARAAPIT
jgi:hypothetical protein